MCYNHIQYDESRTSATVTARCRTDPAIDRVIYSWNGDGYKTDNTYKVDSSFTEPLTLTVMAVDDDYSETNTPYTYTIDLEAVNFVWQGANIEQSDVYKNGQKGAIVEMFGWPYADVKEECSYLASQGWMGVKVFPVSESVFSYEWPQNGELNPWWFYYQPVSY